MISNHIDKGCPLVTVLMPAYNAEKFLHEAIDSILNQTYTNIEFIIINDGSQDKTEKIIKSYSDRRIRYVKNEKNLQLIKTLNKGIDLARGKYIARMDADDVSLSQRIEKEVDFLEKNTNIDIVSCFPYNMSMEGKILCKSSYFSCTYPNACKFVAIFEPPIMHPGVMFRTDMIRKYKYNDKPEYYHIEAYELWNRLMFEESVMGAMIPEFLLNYRDNTTSITHVHNEDALVKHKSILVRSLQNYLGLSSSDEVLLCVMTKSNVSSIKTIEKSFKLLDVASKIFVRNNPKIETRERKEIKDWCNQRKLAILLTSLISAKGFIKVKIMYHLIIRLGLFFTWHNIMYVKNRLVRMYNE